MSEEKEQKLEQKDYIPEEKEKELTKLIADLHKQYGTNATLVCIAKNLAAYTFEVTKSDHMVVENEYYKVDIEIHLDTQEEPDTLDETNK